MKKVLENVKENQTLINFDMLSFDKVIAANCLNFYIR